MFPDRLPGRHGWMRPAGAGLFVFAIHTIPSAAAVTGITCEIIYTGCCEEAAAARTQCCNIKINSSELNVMLSVMRS